MALDDYLAQEIALDCADGLLSRREALRRLTLLGLGASAAAALLTACGSDSGGATTPSAPTSSAAGTSAPSSAPATSASSAPATSAGAATTAAPATTTAPSTAPETSADATAPPDTAATPASTAAPPATPTAEEIRFPGPRGGLIGVLATAADPQGAVLVIHENRGLSAHIRTIPERLAVDGYTALAIDLLSEEGGTASLPSEGDATAALGAAPLERLIEDLRAGLDELERRAPGEKLAAIGFCFGGGMTWQLLSAGEPRLSAAVPWYGPAPADADFSGSQNAAVLAIYAELDTRVNATQEAARVALEAAGLTHQVLVVPGVDHAFFNDTGPRYNPEGAAVAYATMTSWFATHLAS